MPENAKPQRLFLSYGRRDAAELANRLRGDLERLGYEVWQDTREIRAGREWEEQIADGLRSTQVVIALLSPHAVRRASDPNSPDSVDSVCMDELTFARFAALPTPIVPVMAIPREPPFPVFRLDYVSMTQWMHSEDEYQRGFERLVARIEVAATQTSNDCTSDSPSPPQFENRPKEVGSNAQNICTPSVNTDSRTRAVSLTSNAIRIGAGLFHFIQGSATRRRVDKARFICGTLIEACGWYAALVLAFVFTGMIIDHVSIANGHVLRSVISAFNNSLPGFSLVVYLASFDGLSGGLTPVVGFVTIGKRLRLPRKPVPALRQDLNKKHAVLYLRSFASDSDLRDLRHVFGEMVELVMIGRPNEVVPELGGKRFYAGDDWQTHVTEMMKNAELVILRVGSTQGLAWELSECIRMCPPRKIVLMLPLHPDASIRARSEPKTVAEAIWAISGDMESELASQLERIFEFEAFKLLLDPLQQVRLPHNWTGSIIAGFDHNLGLRIPTRLSGSSNSLRKAMQFRERVSVELEELSTGYRHLLRHPTAYVLKQAALRLRIQRWILFLCVISVLGLCVWQSVIDFERVASETMKPFRSVLLMSVCSTLICAYLWQTKPWYAFRRVAALQATLKEALRE